MTLCLCFGVEVDMLNPVNSKLVINISLFLIPIPFIKQLALMQ